MHLPGPNSKPVEPEVFNLVVGHVQRGHCPEVGRFALKGEDLHMSGICNYLCISSLVSAMVHNLPVKCGVHAAYGTTDVSTSLTLHAVENFAKIPFSESKEVYFALPRL